MTRKAGARSPAFSYRAVQPLCAGRHGTYTIFRDYILDRPRQGRHPYAILAVPAAR